MPVKKFTSDKGVVSYGGYAQRWKPSPFQLRLAHSRRMKLKKLARTVRGY